MRKSGIVFGILIIGTILAYLFGSKYGLKFGNIIIAPSKDKRVLEELTRSFIEDIQFKDFKTAARYHTPEDVDKVDIPFLLERIFQIKPETLDIQSYEIMKVEIDSSGDRGRVLTKTTVKILNKDEIRKPEVVYYWFRRDGQWYMRLESSLRPLESEKKGSTSRPKISG